MSVSDETINGWAKGPGTTEDQKCQNSEQAIKKAPDLETGRRIQDLLKTVETSLTPETLRDYRGLLILEMNGTPAARQLLSEIARGDTDAGKTRMAVAALQRLK